jgi:hypothetical protein
VQANLGVNIALTGKSAMRTFKTAMKECWSITKNWQISRENIVQIMYVTGSKSNGWLEKMERMKVDKVIDDYILLIKNLRLWNEKAKRLKGILNNEIFSQTRKTSFYLSEM